MKAIASLLLGAMTVPFAQAQDAPSPDAQQAAPAAAVEAVDLSVLPVEVRAAIGRAVSVSEILQVRGVERVDAQTLAVDELIFKPNGTIEFTGHHPWVLLFAKRIRIEDPRSLLGIRRNMAILAGPKGADGGAGPRGGRGGTSGANGDRGGAGGRGGDGAAGATTKIPDIYIVAGRLEATGSSQPISQARIGIDFRGVPGGAGGAGGPGGAGGSGGDGRNGRRGDFGDCRRGPGDGGNGGNGGPGGNGGAGANGSNGGAVYIIGSAAIADIFTAGDILTSAGGAGAGGAAGAGGPGGGGGPRGSRPGTCGGGSPGSDGASGARGTAGASGQPGIRGRIFTVRLDSLETLQPAAQ